MALKLENILLGIQRTKVLPDQSIHVKQQNYPVLDVLKIKSLYLRYFWSLKWGSFVHGKDDRDV